jgi:hypothetical protein
MDFTAIVFAAPASQASADLNVLVARHRDLLARIREVEDERDEAHRVAGEASAALARLEQRKASGEPVDAAEVKRAEQALTKARGRALEPWGERIAGTRDAARGAEQELQRHCAERFDALMAELDDEARAVAERVDAALREVGAAYLAREQVSGRVHALVAAAVGSSKPNAVAMSRVEKLARLAEAVVMAGGERPLSLVRDPRVPPADTIAEVGA